MKADLPGAIEATSVQQSQELRGGEGMAEVLNEVPFQEPRKLIELEAGPSHPLPLPSSAAMAKLSPLPGPQFPHLHVKGCGTRWPLKFSSAWPSQSGF